MSLSGIISNVLLAGLVRTDCSGTVKRKSFGLIDETINKPQTIQSVRGTFILDIFHLPRDGWISPSVLFFDAVLKNSQTFPTEIRNKNMAYQHIQEGVTSHSVTAPTCTPNDMHKQNLGHNWTKK